MNVIVLVAILINATSGAPIAAHQDGGAFQTMEACGEAAQAKGIVPVRDNIAVEYICRQVSKDGAIIPEVKVGPDDSPLNQWLKKQIERQSENNS